MLTNDFEVVRRAGASVADAHLVVHGADVTLCSQPTVGLLRVDEAVGPEAEVSMCWVCLATAQV